MNSRGTKKKPSSSPGKPFHKKSKSKSKSKEKKFNPKDYLEALMDLQNTNCSTNKKRRSTKRDISSALTIATPVLEKTISASKIRSRSSFSQYRKKFASTAREPININLEAVITEEDNIQYTEKTARSNRQEEEEAPRIQSFVKVNKNICAIKIQRAWRNYQTYKMIQRNYLLEKRAQERKISHQQPLLHINLRKSDLQKTLRIKRQSQKQKDSRRDQQLSQTQKIIMERCREENRMHSPVEGMLNDSYQSSNQNSELLVQMKSKQAERLEEVIGMIESQKTNKTHDELLNDLIIKFEQNKKKLEEDMNQQLQFVDLQEPGSSSSERDPLVEEKGKLKQTEEINIQVNLNDYASSESSLGYDYQNITDGQPEFKIFTQRLEVIKHKKLEALERVDDDADEGRITNNQAMKKKDQIYGRYEREKRQIQKNKKQYLFSLTQLKRNAISCHRQNMKESSSSSKLRKSFSVGSAIIKTVLQDIKLVEISGQNSEKSLLLKLFSRQKDQNDDGIDCSKPIMLDTPDHSSPGRSISEILSDKNNTELMKSYSEDIQDQIQKFLLEQFTNQVFLDENLFKYFKPFVEEVYEFKKIPDEEITVFIEKMERFLPHENKMLARVNQKINPTSQEILRIIRDLDYEIDQYELIIPEESFKGYRQDLEKSYEQKNNSKNEKLYEMEKNIKDYKVIQKIYERQVEKGQKMKKYRNFERDLKIMYMKSVFNCINELLIETKSANAFMNGRSSIGPGELTLAIKEYNEQYDSKQYNNLLRQVKGRLEKLIRGKCIIPSFTNYYDLQIFQRQVMAQISTEYGDSEFKWVNYMDEVLEIWEDLCGLIIKKLIDEAARDILSLL